MNLGRSIVLAGAVAAFGCAQDKPCAGWTQWSQSGSHQSSVCVAGQTPNKVLATVTVDPFGWQETGSDDGDLLVHYQVPLVVGDDVYVLQKGGSFTAPCEQPDGGGEVGCYAWDSQTWGEARYHWSGNTLVQDWMAPSDWKPVPSEFASSQPLFQPVIVGDFLYLPGAGGTVYKIDRHRGTVLAHLDPFGVGTPDPDRYVSGPLVADQAGRVWYNVLKLDHDTPLEADANGWLVVLTANDQAVAFDYDDLVADAPTGTSCHGTYAGMETPPPLPWPPLDPNGNPIPPPPVECGSQRPGLNVAPAVGADGTIYTVSRAQFSSRDSFLVAIGPDLSPRWTASLRDRLSDYCGVVVPIDGDPVDHPNDCTVGTPPGIERLTGELPAARVIDESSSSPVALPDGSVLYGAYTSYNDVRGHLFKFSHDGKLQATYDYGWDYTPAVWQHGNTYSIVVKDNHYVYDDMGTPLGPYYITQLDPNLKIEWQYKNTNTDSCKYNASGQLECVTDHPNGFEWCINAPAIDENGTVYAGGEDGVVYAIGQGGVDEGHLFLSMSLGASYTPLSIDHAGRLYTQNDGKMVVVGR